MTDVPGRILILIKPDAVKRRLIGEILRRIEAKGYDIIALDRLRATPELLAEHYAEHVDRPFYPSIVEYMTSGPLVAAIVEGHRVVEGTIRGDLGRDWGTSAMENLVHGSDSPESAEREIAIWFPRFAR